VQQKNFGYRANTNSICYLPMITILTPMTCNFFHKVPITIHKARGLNVRRSNGGT